MRGFDDLVITKSSPFLDKGFMASVGLGATRTVVNDHDAGGFRREAIQFSKERHTDSFGHLGFDNPG